MFGLVTKATYDADMALQHSALAAKDVEISALTEALTTARENERTRCKQADRAIAERDGVRTALKAAEAQLAQANARLAVLTTRGPGGRFVRPVCHSNGVEVRA